ncbi:hypothetical protein PNOK_0824900 [Pyrrhoderma noxium]|uniref:C2H2-type domain-containing protein n=1 Tax=Pyrrhoderma noxium TaxID=2282107 RepID=A0A286UAN4_9AGAM|nr:hypothetical protein PNOK_0824900 [Pyrrhoderma noxium]
MENIDKDMLNKLNMQSGNGPRNRSSVNTLQSFHIPGQNGLGSQPRIQHEQSLEGNGTRMRARIGNHIRTNTHSVSSAARQRDGSSANSSVQEFYHISSPDDPRSWPLTQHGRSLEGNNTRVGTTIKCDPRTNPFSATSAAEQHGRQAVDKLNSREPTQQSTPIVMSQGYRAPANSRISKTIHWGYEPTTSTQIEQMRKSTSLPPVSIPPKVFGHPRDSHHPIQPEIQRMQRTTNNRPNQHATQMMNFNYGNRPMQQSPSVATPQVNRAHTSLIPQSAAHEGPRSETGIQAEGMRRLAQFASGSASLPSRAHGYSSHHPIQLTSQTIQRTTNDRAGTAHHRSANSVFSQVSPKTIEAMERVGVIPGPPTAPRQNVASAIYQLHSRTQVPLEPQAEVWKCERCAQTFTDELELGGHLKCRKKIKCTIADCSKKFCHKTDYDTHIYTAHNYKVYFCSKCLLRNVDSGLSSKSELREHMKTCTQ